ncbi:MAG: hypothetical protein ABI702_19680 [Burkholderiales bacterium]
MKPLTASLVIGPVALALGLSCRPANFLNGTVAFTPVVHCHCDPHVVSREGSDDGPVRDFSVTIGSTGNSALAM